MQLFNISNEVKDLPLIDHNKVKNIHEFNVLSLS
jgi:hypothetical protein